MSTKFTLLALRNCESLAPALFIILITNLIGCSPVAAETPPNSAGEAVILTSTPFDHPTETPFPTPTQMPFVPKATIKIVVHVNPSGGQPNYDTNIIHGAELAVQQLTGPLRELGYQIELVTFDDHGNIEFGVMNAKKIVADPEIRCGIGHRNSRIMVQASEIYHKEGLAFVSPEDTSTAVTDRGYLEINRITGRDDGQGRADALFAQEKGFTSVFIISNNSADSKKIVDYFKREAESIEVKAISIPISDVREDLDGVIRRMMATNPDLVYFAGRPSQAGQFFREARAAGYMGTFLGSDESNNPDLVDLAGPLLVEGGGMYFTDMAAPTSYYPDSAQFIRDFNFYYGSSPKLYAAQAYDAAGICMRAIEEASKARGGELPARQDVAHAIRTLVDYKGITGTYNFNEKGDSALAKYFVFKVISADPNKWGQNTAVATFEMEPPK